VAIAFATNDIAACSNGGTVLTDATATVPTTNITTMAVGNWAGNNYLNGWISSLSYYGARLPNATLQALTA
jgi:hypothetical protein